MNDDTDQFEHRLRRQPLRVVPPDWRSEILAAAQAAQTPALVHASCLAHQTWLSSILHPLSSLLWPHPKAWAGLAAAWVLIVGLNLSMREPQATSLRLAEKSAPPSPEVIVELRQQQRLFAELVGLREERDTDRAKEFKPHPRTKCGVVLTA